jgi:hypothetical protein
MVCRRSQRSGSRNGVHGMQAFAEMKKTKGVADSVETAWRGCFSLLGKDNEMAIAVRDLKGMQADGVSDGQLAVVMINNLQYRGRLDSVRMHASTALGHACKHCTARDWTGARADGRMHAGACDEGGMQRVDPRGGGKAAGVQNDDAGSVQARQ